MWVFVFVFVCVRVSVTCYAYSDSVRVLSLGTSRINRDHVFDVRRVGAETGVVVGPTIYRVRM